MARRPSADDLRRLCGLSLMPTEKVHFAQTSVDPKSGAGGKPLCSAIVALVTADPSAFAPRRWGSDRDPIPARRYSGTSRGEPSSNAICVAPARLTVSEKTSGRL